MPVRTVQLSQPTMQTLSIRPVFGSFKTGGCFGSCHYVNKHLTIRVGRLQRQGGAWCCCTWPECCPIPCLLVHGSACPFEAKRITRRRDGETGSWYDQATTVAPLPVSAPKSAPSCRVLFPPACMYSTPHCCHATSSSHPHRSNSSPTPSRQQRSARQQQCDADSTDSGCAAGHRL